MSESVFKFYPLEPNRGFRGDEAQVLISTILEVGSTSVVRDSIGVKEYDGIQFIDCGLRLERIKCPLCGTEIQNSEWQRAMDADYDDAKGFGLSEMVNCQCSRQSPLHGLNYKASCGFSRSWVSVTVYSHFWTGWIRQYPWFGVVEARY